MCRTERRVEPGVASDIVSCEITGDEDVIRPVEPEQKPGCTGRVANRNWSHLDILNDAGPRRVQGVELRGDCVRVRETESLRVDGQQLLQDGDCLRGRVDSCAVSENAFE